MQMKESHIVANVDMLFMEEINFAQNAGQNPNQKKRTNFPQYHSLMFQEGNKPEI